MCVFFVRFFFALGLVVEELPLRLQTVKVSEIFKFTKLSVFYGFLFVFFLSFSLPAHLLPVPEVHVDLQLVVKGHALKKNN